MPRRAPASRAPSETPYADGPPPSCLKTTSGHQQPAFPEEDEAHSQKDGLKSGRVPNVPDIRSIDKKTLDLLQSYDWPGNIRELQNVIERSIILSTTDVFFVDELWLSQGPSPQASRSETSPASNVEARTEREIIEAALAETRGRISGPSGAAANLRIPASTLNTRIKALKINKQQFKYRLTSRSQCSDYAGFAELAEFRRFTAKRTAIDSTSSCLFIDLAMARALLSLGSIAT